jgi:hypothetical protein
MRGRRHLFAGGSDRASGTCNTIRSVEAMLHGRMINLRLDRLERLKI